MSAQQQRFVSWSDIVLPPSVFSWTTFRSLLASFTKLSPTKTCESVLVTFNEQKISTPLVSCPPPRKYNKNRSKIRKTLVSNPIQARSTRPTAKSERLSFARNSGFNQVINGAKLDLPFWHFSSSFDWLVLLKCSKEIPRTSYQTRRASRLRSHTDQWA